MNDQQIVPLNNGRLIVTAGLGVTQIQNIVNLGTTIYNNVPDVSLTDISTQVNQYIEDTHSNFNQLRDILSYNQAMGPQGIPLSVLEEQSRERKRLKITNYEINTPQEEYESPVINILYLIKGALLK